VGHPLDEEGSTMSDLPQRLRLAKPNSLTAAVLSNEAADRIEALEAELERAKASERSAWNAAVARDERLELVRGALADISTSRDMTLTLARKKAHRVYAETEPEGASRDTPQG
jgi:hypothetical protein